MAQTSRRAAEAPIAYPPGVNPMWGPGWADLRALWPLDYSVAHLNHGSFGAVPTPVLARQSAYRERAAANPMRFFRRELPAEREKARLAVAVFLGADPEGLAFVPNATTGVNGVLRSIELDPGDEVVVTDHGYGGVRCAVESAIRQAGARMVAAQIPLSAGPADIVAMVGAAATARTKLFIVDHVTSPTAKLFPVDHLVAAARERAVPLLVDAAHTAGMLPVDLERLAPDFWVSDLHKWVCAPQGAAVLYAGPAYRSSVRSVVVSWGEPLGFPRSYGDIGTIDQSAWLAAPAAIDLLARVGWARVRAYNAELAAHGQHVVAAALGLNTAVLPADSGISMRLVPLPDELGADEAAIDELITMIAGTLGVEVSATAWRGRPFLRLSAHIYNQPADYQRLADGLLGVLHQMRRR